MAGTPKSSELRAIEGGSPRKGTVSHRPIPPVVEFSPKITRVPDPPEELAEEGRALWRQVVPWLVEVNAVQQVDLPAIFAMCVSWQTAERARKVLDEQGWFILGSVGQMTAHPAVAIMQGAHDRFLRFAQDFGLTTTARTRLGLMDVQKKSIQQDMDWTLGPSTRKAR